MCRHGRDKVIRLWRLTVPAEPAELLPDGAALVAAEEMRWIRVDAGGFCRAAWHRVPSTQQLLIAAPGADESEVRCMADVTRRH